ncbi:putative pentatricopeptide repeat-containing protein [Hirschfeldia incana]|nr:putative pentatricopeptide repeat-containing protein [Hirschfeldia incana]
MSIATISPSSKLHQIKTLISLASTANHLKQIHASLIPHALNNDTYLVNLLLKRTLSFRENRYSFLLFSHTQFPNIFLYNTLINGFVNNNLFRETLDLFLSIRKQHGLSLYGFTFPFVLKACARSQNHALGIELHPLVVKCGFNRDVGAMTSLLSLYSGCGRVHDARKVFDEIPERTIVSWTALISGCIASGKHGDAIGLFKEMVEVGVRPDSYSVVRVLSACVQVGDLDSAEWIADLVEEIEMQKNSYVNTTLVNLYAKRGKMEKARCVFDSMAEKDIVTWSTMIQGYASNSLPKEGVELFHQMLREDLKPDQYSIVGFLSSCASLGALDLGEWGSGLIDRDEFLTNMIMGNALIDMYAKCGDMARGFQVFKDMKEKDRVIMNTAITGLAKNGHVMLSFAVFGQTVKLGISPDGYTFLGLLCGCVHAGLIQDGLRFFNSISSVYSLKRTVEHYGCMVDLWGRAGKLGEAYRLICDMPMKPNAIIWGALLTGCRLVKETRLAERVLKELIALEPWNAGNYVQLSNIYSVNGRWDEAAEVREEMNKKGMKKLPGWSWIELEGKVHEFLADDKSHPLSAKIYAKLEDLGNEMRLMGFVPTTECVMFDVEEEEKETVLGYHSEKLAVALGLISTGHDEVIRVVKNLRVCGDCHQAMKLISKITRREIVVRDNNRFHCFTNGSCSCNDYW